MKTVCFTGHRPNKLGGYDWNSKKNILIRKCIKNEILILIGKSASEKSTLEKFIKSLGLKKLLV